MGGGPVVHPDTGDQYITTEQKAVDVGLAFHLMRSHRRREWEKLFLAAGDGDFHEVVQHLVEEMNVNLFLVGSVNSMSEKLRSYATGIIELRDIADDIARPRGPAAPAAPVQGD